MLPKIFFFFAFVSSSVLCYGIGVKRIFDLSKRPEFFLFRMAAALCVSVLSVMAAWLVSQHILVPLRLQELLPLICALVFIPFAAAGDFVLGKICPVRFSETAVVFPSVLLALVVSPTFGAAVLSVVCCVLSCYLLTPILYAVRQRLRSARLMRDFKSGGAVLVSLAVIMCALYAWNIVWFHI
ncbi:MAG: hypothetical protein NC041_04260 [Bacteroides sp.]|nr:hypothetical protein [Prevotella sp.]MCM1407919.1 hypothetical protein [Treponema brennaborense]MCM1469661.1 hypothetical protein [Bacteroides sp.]